MHAYILENDNEVSRLEKQNSLKNYCVSEELKDINISSDMHILDAGCGTGVITRHVLKNFNPKEVTAVDFSQTRLAQAKKFISTSSTTSTVNFKQLDMMSEKLEEEQFDLIISRFVMHHLTVPQKAISMLSRALKHGGRLCVIDSDGIMFNMHSKDLWLQKALDKINSSLEIDMFVGRKLKMFMDQSNLTNLESRIIPMHFTGYDLQQEKIQYEERFFALGGLLESILGKDSVKFVERYLAAFDEPSTELFYNKFVTQGTRK